MGTRAAAITTRWVTCAAILASCSSHAHPPSIGDADGGATVVVTASGGGCVPDTTAAPAPDAQGLCGNLFLSATGAPPNVYFVIDRSGSMQEVVDGQQKYAAISNGAVKLVRALGSRANVGAAVFPAPSSVQSCAPGEEVFPTTPGDVAAPTVCAGDGKVTSAFSRAISLPGRADPSGSTPTAATLTALTPNLAALPGRTAVILATDGGPNCNEKATCTAAECIPNIEGQCTANLNCCDARLYGPSACLDAAPTRAAVAELLRRGIKTYVVGVPGSGPYGALLTDLANAGGTARSSAPAYYQVDHVAELDAVLSAIGDSVTVSCEQTLSETPPAPGLVNVYLDGHLIPYGAADGWRWSDSDPAGAVTPPDASASEAAAVTPPDASASEASTGASGENGDATVTSVAVPDGAPPGVSADASAAPSAYRTFRFTGSVCADLESRRARQVQVTFGCPTAVVN